MRVIKNQGILASLAISFTLSGGLAMAQVPVNSVNDGQIIQGGTYANTANGITTFKNSTGSGLWLQTGSNLRGIEVDTVGRPTNNGGAFHFDAPGQVVRLDGNVDVRATQNGDFDFQGNGGKVSIDAGYLFQNGNIYANGLNGGQVQINVGAATLGNSAQIQAKGSSGVGGTIAINASGSVETGRQSVIDSSGKVTGTVDSNIINIEGGLLNLQGNLQAVGTEDSRGGVIRLVSTGQTDLAQSKQAIQSGQNSGLFTSTEASNQIAHLATLKASNDGDTVVAAADGSSPQAMISASGTFSSSVPGHGVTDGNDPSNPTLRAGDGGTIIITAAHNVQNGGWVLANGARGNGSSTATDVMSGGDGGTISINAGSTIQNTGRVITNGGNGGNGPNANTGGNGGNGGLIAFGYKDGMQNSGVITANGGNPGTQDGSSVIGNQGAGGLIAFSGPSNQTGNGTVIANLGLQSNAHPQLGTILAPDPASSSNTLIGVWRKTTGLELLTHAENLIFLRSNLPIAKASNDFFNSWVANSMVRSVTAPQGIGTNGPAWDEVDQKTAKVGGIVHDYTYRNLIFNSSTPDKVFFDGSFTAQSGQVNQTPLNTMTLLSAGPIIFGKSNGAEDPVVFGNGDGGGRFSSISSSFTPNGQSNITLNGGLMGGSFNIAASDLITLNGMLSQGGIRHGGSTILKSGRYLSILDDSRISSSSSVMGGVQQILAQSTIANHGSLEANGGFNGGNILLEAPDKVFNGTNHIQANGGPYGGGINIFTNNPLDNNGQIEAQGTTQNGTISVNPIP